MARDHTRNEPKTGYSKSPELAQQAPPPEQIIESAVAVTQPAPEPAPEKAPELSDKAPISTQEAERVVEKLPAEPKRQPPRPPTAEELTAGGPRISDLVDMGYSDTIAANLMGAFESMRESIREILRPALSPASSVSIRSTAERGHFRCQRKWTATPTLFKLDDPFLSEKNVEALKSDPRIQIKFPKG